MFSIPYLFLEVKANRDFLKDYFYRQLLIQKYRYIGKTEEIEHKIVSSSNLFSGKTGRFLARQLALAFTFFWEVKKVLCITVFSRYTILALCVFGIIFEIFVITSTVDVIIMFLTLVWVLVINLFRFKSMITIIPAIIFLTITPFLLIVNSNFKADKFATWAYMFLLVGVIQLTWENRNEIFEKNEI